MIRLTFPLRRAPFVTQEFGQNPDYYSQFSVDGVRLKGHNGLDLRAEIGVEVIASDSGFAQEVKDQGNAGYGRYIKLVHDWGETIYAHLKSFSIKQGDQVSRGQTIALSNNTGNSTGPHLHYGVRVNPYNRKDGWGGYTNPAPLLFEGESSDSLPKWLLNLITENQEDIGQAESAIRKWLGGFKDYAGIKENLDGYIRERKDLYFLVGISEGKPFPEVLSKITDWREGYLRENDISKKYREFIEDLAKRLNITDLTEKAVKEAVKSLVMGKIEGNSHWWEYILLGLAKLFKKRNEE